MTGLILDFVLRIDHKRRKRHTGYDVMRWTFVARVGDLRDRVWDPVGTKLRFGIGWAFLSLYDMMTNVSTIVACQKDSS